MLNRGFHCGVSVIHDEVRSEIRITCSSIDCEKQMQHYKRSHAYYADGFSGSDEAEREKKKNLHSHLALTFSVYVDILSGRRRERMLMLSVCVARPHLEVFWHRIMI